MNYISKYKCRYCGEVFENEITASKQIAFRSVICIELNEKPKHDLFAEKAMHLKPDHYGIGDLIGIEKVGGES